MGTGSQGAGVGVSHALLKADEPRPGRQAHFDLDLLLRSSPCRVCLVAPPRVPDEVAD